MKLSQVLFRKRKMITKPPSYVRNMEWNNSWYLQQERPVRNFNIKEKLEERNIPIYSLDEIISPYTPAPTRLNLEDTITTWKEQKRDETHPLWKEEPAYTYKDNSWQPRDDELVFAQAVTNTLASGALPQELLNRFDSIQVSSETKQRLENLLKTCYIGDATQVKLPRNFKVPFIGWHPVESKMAPRNQYDWKAFSWGRKMPREYGIPNTRKLLNLTRGLFKEMCKDQQVSVLDQHFLENNKIRQFIRRPDGKLLRYFLTVPFVVTGSSPRQAYSRALEQDSKIPDVFPLDPVAGMFTDHIYEATNNHPVSSLQSHHPHIHTVVYHNASHIAPKYKEDTERAKCLFLAYAAAIGQARLVYGADYCSDLQSPVTINSISTNGQKFTLSSFQLNSLDLASSKPNYFYYHDTTLDLFEFCGYDNSRVSLRGLNTETYRWLEAVMFPEQGVRQRKTISN